MGCLWSPRSSSGAPGRQAVKRWSLAGCPRSRLRVGRVASPAQAYHRPRQTPLHPSYLVPRPVLDTPPRDSSIIMAFQSLMSGSECSTSANPLSQLLKQQQTDRSLHQGPSLQSSGPLPGTLRTHSPMQGGGQEAEQFFAGGQMGNGGAVKGGELMGMGGLRRELDGLTRGQQQHPGQGKSD